MPRAPADAASSSASCSRSAWWHGSPGRADPRRTAASPRRCGCSRPPAGSSAALRRTAPPARSCSSRSSPPASGPSCRGPFIVVGVGILALAVAVLVYDGSALGLLAYSLGFAAATLAGANARQAAVRAEQAELLLAQTQRSHEEQLRAARLEESTRIAREIHDVLAHALAGLTIQLEATSALVDQGADPVTIKARLDRAHALAREGLRETRRAVGALRGEPIAAQAGIEALVAGVPGRRRGRRADDRRRSRPSRRPGRRGRSARRPGGPHQRPQARAGRERVGRAARRRAARTATSSSSSMTTRTASRQLRARWPRPAAATVSRACANVRRLSAAPSRRAPRGWLAGANCTYRLSPGRRPPPDAPHASLGGASRE